MSEIIYNLSKRRCKIVWRACNSRNLVNEVLQRPRKNFLYFDFEQISPFSTRRGNPRRVIKRNSGGALIFDLDNTTAFDALLKTFCSNPGDHMHIRVYSVFSPCCATNDIEKLLAYLTEKKTITMDIYFANIHGFRINNPEQWLTKDKIADGIKLRRLANHKSIKEFQIFGRREWEFIADKLGEEYHYQPKAVEDVWDKTTYEDEEYSDVWKAIMDNKLGELRHRIWKQFPTPLPKIEESASSCQLLLVDECAPVVEEDEYFGHYSLDFANFYQEEFPSQKGVDKRTRPIGRNEWKNIAREATMLANFG